MSTKSGHRRIHSAYANSVGAFLTKPSAAWLDDVPCASLPVTGGFVSQDKENIRLRMKSLDVLKIGRASSTVHGEAREGGHTTLATCKLEKVNIHDMVTADVIIGKITSFCPVPAKTRGRGKPEPAHGRFSFAGSSIDNLKVDGKPITHRVHPDFAKEFVLDKRFAGKANTHRRLFTGGSVAIHIPQFGDIYFGELELYGSKAILTMVRVELGCAVEGSIAAATQSTNGTDGLTNGTDGLTNGTDGLTNGTDG